MVGTHPEPEESTNEELQGAAVALSAAAIGALSIGSIVDAATARKHKRHNTTARSTHSASARGAETELTGDALQKATDAAKAAVPGGTVWRASTEDPSDASGAAYEVHVTKTDGSEVEVLLDSSFNVVKTQAGPQHAGGRDSRH